MPSANSKAKNGAQTPALRAKKRHIGAVAVGFTQPPEAQCTIFVRFVRHEDRDQSLAIGDEVGPGEIAFALASALLAQRKQPAQTRIGLPIDWVDQDRNAVAEIKPAADH